MPLAPYAEPAIREEEWHGAMLLRRRFPFVLEVGVHAAASALATAANLMAAVKWCSSSARAPRVLLLLRVHHDPQWE